MKKKSGKKVCFFANAPMDLIKIVEFYKTDIRILKELGFDVKISNSFKNIPLDCDLYFAYWASSGAKAVLLSKILRKPSVVIAAGSDVCKSDPTAAGFDARPRWQKKIIRWCLRNADVVVADSNHVMEETKHAEPKTKNLKMSYLATDIKKYRPLNVKKEDILIIVSHLSMQNVERKRLIDIIEAMKYVVKKVPKSKFIFIGSQLDGYPYLKDIAEKLGLKNNIKFIAPCEEKEKIKYLNKAKGFVQPSLHEGFGVAMAEAMACGLPVIVTKRGATPEVAGDAAVFTPVKNPKVLAKNMVKVLKNEKLRKSLGKGARKRIIERFSYEQRKNEIKKIIEEVMR